MALVVNPPSSCRTWRSAPGSAHLNTTCFGSAGMRRSNTSRHDGSHTMTISATSRMCAKVSMLYVAISCPRSFRYCLGMDAPMRLPTPPASSTTETLPVATALGGCGWEEDGAAWAGGSREVPRVSSVVALRERGDDGDHAGIAAPVRAETAGRRLCTKHATDGVVVFFWICPVLSDVRIEAMIEI